MREINIAELWVLLTDTCCRSSYNLLRSVLVSGCCLDCTWSPSVALDLELIISQLHSQAKVRDTDVTCESKHRVKSRAVHVTDMNVDLHAASVTR